MINYFMEAVKMKNTFFFLGIFLIIFVDILIIKGVF